MFHFCAIHQRGKTICKSCYFCKHLCVHSYTTKDAKVDKGVPLFISDEYIVKQSKKVCNKIIFINIQFIKFGYEMIFKINSILSEISSKSVDTLICFTVNSQY